VSVSIESVRAALADILRPEQVPDVHVAEGRVTVSVAVDVPTPEKPRFAEEVKKRVRTLPGVTGVLVTYAKAPPSAAPAEANPLEGVKRIVAVGAGKGGVGKSTVAVNLAVALARAGFRTGLLDADIYGPSVGIMTGTQDHKARGDEHQRILPAERYGVKIISIAFLLPEDRSAVVWRGPMVGKMVTQLLTSVAWGELDYLVVDLPPGTGDAVLSLTQTVPLAGAVVVTTPQDVALLDVLKAIEMFRQVKVPVLGIVENMAGFTCGHCGKVTPIFLEGAGRKAAERYDLKLLGSLPLDPAIPPGGDAGRPIMAVAPESPAGKTFQEIARLIPLQINELGESAPAAAFDWK
jgi:ATP-binding protein involved in chromosome partitioning